MSSETTTMERPILFAAPMVRALLAGTKTQTRRIIDIDHAETKGLRLVDGILRTFIGDVTGQAESDPEAWLMVQAGWETGMGCKYGQPGDRLWVRETLARHGDFAIYRADGSDVRHELATSAIVAGDPCDALGRPWQQTWGWKRDVLPSIHMPRWASRITLEITDMRVQRLNGISVNDAIAEGCFEENRYHSEPGLPYPVATYKQLWNEINGAGSWDANQWVWAISFKRVQP